MKNNGKISNSPDVLGAGFSPASHMDEPKTDNRLSLSPEVLDRYFPAMSPAPVLAIQESRAGIRVILDDWSAARACARAKLIRHRGGHSWEQGVYDYIGHTISSWDPISKAFVHQHIEAFLLGLQLGLGVSGLVLGNGKNIRAVYRNMVDLPWGKSGEAGASARYTDFCRRHLEHPYDDRPGAVSVTRRDLWDRFVRVLFPGRVTEMLGRDRKRYETKFMAELGRSVALCFPDAVARENIRVPSYDEHRKYVGHKRHRGWDNLRLRDLACPDLRVEVTAAMAHTAEVAKAKTDRQAAEDHRDHLVWSGIKGAQLRETEEAEQREHYRAQRRVLEHQRAEVIRAEEADSQRREEEHRVAREADRRLAGFAHHMDEVARADYEAQVAQYGVAYARQHLRNTSILSGEAKIIGSSAATQPTQP